MKPFLLPINIPPQQYETLAGLARECLSACRAQGHDGTVIFRPDGTGHYDAMWTRDLCYMVEGAGTVMDPQEVLAAIDYVIAGQREDGTVPDRVLPDGTPIYLGGPVDKPLGHRPPTDNAQFLVKLVSAYVKLTKDLDAFLDRRSALYTAMDTVPLSADKLVHVDRNRPHASYGFTDCITKTGNVFFSTLLYWEACQTLAKLCADSEYHDEAHEWYEKAEHSSRRMNDFWNDEYGLFWAASEHCHQIDLWGSVYACVVRAASKTQARRVADYFVALADECVLHGQLRHVPAGEHWHRTMVDVPRGTYQNGGYWATPTGWLVRTVHLLDPELARKIVTDVTEDFVTYGVHEWINEKQRALPGYVASIANVLGSVQPAQKLAQGDVPEEPPSEDAE